VSGRCGTNSFREIHAEDLERWAGVKTFSRGRNYQREKRVKELICMESGELAGSVAGSERYVVVVSVTDGEIQSCCSCPVGFDCKHAVALVLEYLDREKKGHSVQVLSADDPRFITITMAFAKSGIDVASMFDTGGKTGSGPGYESLRSYLSEYTKDELLDLLLDLARAIQEVDQFLSDRQAIERKNFGQK